MINQFTAARVEAVGKSCCARMANTRQSQSVIYEKSTGKIHERRVFTKSYQSPLIISDPMKRTLANEFISQTIPELPADPSRSTFGRILTLRYIRQCQQHCGFAERARNSRRTKECHASGVHRNNHMAFCLLKRKLSLHSLNIL